MSRASIVIPAHDEGAVIGGTLRALLAESEPDEFDIVVVANGCSDDTAARARAFPVRVVEIDAASKPAALNVGDRVAEHFPRIYLDADIRVDTSAVRRTVAALREEGAMVAAPRPVVDTRGCGPTAKAYFAVWRRLGYSTRSSAGSGLYGLSRAARDRFGHFPDIIADDGYVYTTFSAAERVNPAGAVFVIRAPRTWQALLARRVRIEVGNMELVQLHDRHLAPPPPGWAAVLRRRPWLLPAGTVYVAVNLRAKVLARRRLRAGGERVWGQDRTSRTAA